MRRRVGSWCLRSICSRARYERDAEPASCGRDCEVLSIRAPEVDRVGVGVLVDCFGKARLSVDQWRQVSVVRTWSTTPWSDTGSTRLYSRFTRFPPCWYSFIASAASSACGGNHSSGSPGRDRRAYSSISVMLMRRGISPLMSSRNSLGMCLGMIGCPVSSVVRYAMSAWIDVTIQRYSGSSSSGPYPRSSRVAHSRAQLIQLPRRGRSSSVEGHRWVSVDPVLGLDLLQQALRAIIHARRVPTNTDGKDLRTHEIGSAGDFS